MRSIAPRIAYANPSVPFSISPYRDPRSAEKSKDPKDPSRNADWKLTEEKPQAQMVVEFGTSLSIWNGAAYACFVME